MLRNDTHRKVGIVVVTYHPDLLRWPAALSALCDQGDFVVVCDNSEDIAVSAHVEKSCALTSENVHFISMQGNKGIAAAQNKGIEWLTRQGCSFVLEMDQDATLSSEYVQRMLEVYQMLDQKSVAGIGGASVDLNAGDVSMAPRLASGDLSLRKTGMCLSAGFFFSTEAFRAVGPKDESLFIDYVDWEWCWRAAKAGLNTYLNTSVRVTHRLGERRLRCGPWDVGVPTPIRHYYQYRNSITLMQRSYVPLRWKIERLFVNIAKLPIYCLLTEGQKERCQFIFAGISDALTGRMGKCFDRSL